MVSKDMMEMYIEKGGQALCKIKLKVQLPGST